MPGSETTNDGNTARRFFHDLPLASSVAEVNEDLTERFNVFLRTLTCGYAINVETFKSKHRRKKNCGKMRNLRKFTQNCGKEFLFYALL